MFDLPCESNGILAQRVWREKNQELLILKFLGLRSNVRLSLELRLPVISTAGRNLSGFRKDFSHSFGTTRNVFEYQTGLDGLNGLNSL